MPNVWKPFLILLAFFALQQMSGIYIILFYTVNILKDIGIELNEYSASVGIGVIRLFASIAGADLASSWGRKTLAFISGLGMAISAVGVALTYRSGIVRLIRTVILKWRWPSLKMRKFAYSESPLFVSLLGYLLSVIDINLTD